MQNNKPSLDRRIFWDVDYETIDYESKFRFVIERVFERGDVQDIRNCIKFYGDEKIKDVLLNASFLPIRKLALASAVIDEPIENFKCYIIRQSNPTLFPY